MLEPNQRQHLLQILRPPESYELSFAIGTTYSLDLMALLSVPLAFAQFDWEDESGRPKADPLALLEALRRYADRLHIFCQAGCIAVPQQQLLFGYLENSIFQVTAPLGGVFHPKVWALRFTAPNMPVVYRLLCLSRNLTFDRSWDTILTFEGVLTDRQNGYSNLRPLSDFIKALPTLAQNPIPKQVHDNINLAEQELRRVNFAIPEGFNEFFFHPIGIEGYTNRQPFGNYDRMLVVSPFLAPSFLSEITEQGTNHVLMSRLDSLSALQRQELNGFKKIYALNPMAEIEEVEQESVSTSFFETTLSGLHAKLYVAEKGWNAHLWTGSANATNAAFNKNVEFLIELVGKRSSIGVDAFLETTKEHSKFADLWMDFNPNTEALKSDEVQKYLEEILRSTQIAFASAQWHGQVQPAEKADEYFLQVSCNANLEATPEIEIQYWPLTLSSKSSVTYTNKDSSNTVFGPLAIESLTAFIVFQLTAKKDDQSMTLQFVLHIPLSSMPENRQERLFLSMLKSREQVARFMLFILADGKQDIDGEGITFSVPQNIEVGVTQNKFTSETPLFETLVQALHRDPTRIDQIAQAVADLERSEDGTKLLPEGFKLIWSPIWEVRKRLRS